MAQLERLQQLAQRVEEVAREEYADSFAGLSVAGGRVVVYRKPSSDFDAALRALASPDRIELHDAAHSVRELDRLRDEVLADADFWRERGLEIGSVAVRFDGSGVEVGTGDVERARREFLTRYGASAPVEVVESGPISLLRP